MTATYRTAVDWNADGDFTDPREDVTARTLDGRQQLTFSYGRDQMRAGAPAAAGQGAFTLNNASRDYSPENPASPLAGQVVPDRPVLVTARLGVTDYTVFRGNLDDLTIVPGVGDRVMQVTCADALGRLAGAQVTTGLERAIRTGAAVHMVLDALGWPANLRDIDTGVTVMPYWWLNKADAFEALRDLVDSEGQPALLSSDAQGRIVFRDRHHRLVRAASTTVQSTWRSSGAVEPLISAPTVYNHGWREIVNSVTFEVALRAPTFELAPVWSSQGRISLAAGEATVVTAAATSPFVDAVVPVAGVDYVAASGSVSVALSRTSGEAVDITLTAVGGAADLDNLQVRARAVDTVTTVQVKVEDSASIAKYGRRAPQSEREPKWANVYDALAIGQILVGRRSERLPTISVTFSGSVDARLVQQLGRNLSDRIHLEEADTGLDRDCFVEHIAHTIGQGGAEHRTTFGLEAAPLPVTNPFTFNKAGAGFNDGRFQAMGVVSGTSMFRFDTPGQGFDQGLFAY